MNRQFADVVGVDEVMRYLDDSKGSS